MGNTEALAKVCPHIHQLIKPHLWVTPVLAALDFELAVEVEKIFSIRWHGYPQLAAD